MRTHPAVAFVLSIFLPLVVFALPLRPTLLQDGEAPEIELVADDERASAREPVPAYDDAAIDGALAPRIRRLVDGELDDAATWELLVELVGEARLEALVTAHRESAIEEPRARAAKWTDQFLIRFVDAYLGEERRAAERQQGREAYTAAKVRTWFERFDELEERYPDWNTPLWRTSEPWARKADRLIALRAQFAALYDPNGTVHPSGSMHSNWPLTDADMEWSIFYYTDPSARKGNRFDTAFALLERYRADGGSIAQAHAWEEQLRQRANAFADHFLGLARATYEVANEQGGATLNRQHLTSINHLLLVARHSPLPERANEALDLLERFPLQVDIWKAYAKSADAGDTSAAEKLDFLAGARPVFAEWIAAARAELAAEADPPADGGGR